MIVYVGWMYFYFLCERVNVVVSDFLNVFHISLLSMIIMFSPAHFFFYLIIYISFFFESLNLFIFFFLLIPCCTYLLSFQFTIYFSKFSLIP